jgi:hypothetical protein
MRDDEPTTNVGTEVLFENDVVRVWRMALTPGASSEVHVHEHDHVFVYANPSRMRAREVGSDDVIRQPSDEGFVYYREVGDAGLPPHQLTNAGDTESVHYIVELLGDSRSRTAQPPEHNGRVIEGETLDW